jgi:hypothetical protein
MNTMGFSWNPIDWVSSGWDAATNLYSETEAKALEVAKAKSSQALTLATQKLIPLVSTTTTKVVGTVATPIINVVGKAFSSPPKPAAQVAQATGEQVQYVYEDAAQAVPNYLTAFPKVNTLPVDHPLANILPK